MIKRKEKKQILQVDSNTFCHTYYVTEAQGERKVRGDRSNGHTSLMCQSSLSAVRRGSVTSSHHAHFCIPDMTMTEVLVIMTIPCFLQQQRGIFTWFGFTLQEERINWYCTAEWFQCTLGACSTGRCKMDVELSFFPSWTPCCLVYRSSWLHCLVYRSSWLHCLVYGSSWLHCLVYRSL